MQHRVLAVLRRVLPVLATAMFGAVVFGTAAHAQVGIQPTTWTIDDPSGAGSTAGASSTIEVKAMVWYPTLEPASAQRVGPFRFEAAPGAAVATGRFPLVIVSHGTGGHELGHAWLAEALARSGYVVVTFRQPGDNFEDRSAMASPDYFERRPRQASAVLSALLADPAWSGHVDAARIAVVGHSAGGHTALALAGAEPAPARAVAHCAPDGPGRREDVAMCELGGHRSPEVLKAMTTPREPGARAVRDPRIRAVVVAAPLGVALAPASLRSVDLPVLIESGRRDEVLAPRLHAEALCAALPHATCVASDGAGHFAFFQAGTGPLPSAAGDPSADPAGFDRRAWQLDAAERIRQFLVTALR